MSQIELFPLIGGLMAALGVLYLVTLDRPKSTRLWLLPGILSLLFLLVSLQAVLREGPKGFWAEHTRNLWGNQIWFDLCLASPQRLLLWFHGREQ